MNLLSLRLSYETDISCSVLAAAFFFKKKSTSSKLLFLCQQLRDYPVTYAVQFPGKHPCYGSHETRRGHAAVWGVWRYASNYYWFEKHIQCYILVHQIQVGCHTILHIAEPKLTQGWQEGAQSLYREAKNWIYKNLHSHICNLSANSGLLFFYKHFSFQSHILKKYLKWIKKC